MNKTVSAFIVEWVMDFVNHCVWNKNEKAEQVTQNTDLILISYLQSLV